MHMITCILVMVRRKGSENKSETKGFEEELVEGKYLNVDY